MKTTFYEHYPAAGGIKNYLEESGIEPTPSRLWGMQLYADRMTVRSFVSSLLHKIAENRDCDINEEFPTKYERKAFSSLARSPAYVAMRRLRPELPRTTEPGRGYALQTMIQEHGFSSSEANLLNHIVRSLRDAAIAPQLVERVCETVFRARVWEIFDPRLYGEGVYSEEFREKIHGCRTMDHRRRMPFQLVPQENLLIAPRKDLDDATVDRAKRAFDALTEQQRKIISARCGLRRTQNTLISFVKLTEKLGAKNYQALQQHYAKAIGILREKLGLPPFGEKKRGGKHGSSL